MKDMFLVSTRYALIACRHLAKSYCENRYCSAPEIAETYNMNVRALMPALRQLTRVGILRSKIGGKEPGFIFARNPRDITLLEVLTALEGDHEVMCCKEINPDLRCGCSSKSDCFAYTTFSYLTHQAKAKLTSITIEEYSMR